MDFLELQTETKELLNFNASQTDQDFTLAQVKNAINRAYRREYVRARQEGTRRFFITTTNVVWPASQATLELPNNLQGAQIVRVCDVTSSTPGTELIFSDYGNVGDLHWLNRNTLQWGTGGPSSEKTIQFEYFPGITKMIQDDDEPDLIPSEHREIIFWSSAIDLRNRADEMAPQAWLFERENLRMDFWKEISKNRPHTDTIGVATSYPSLADLVY
jgi:hypothetical protein|tara:strand:- start:1429 stop:2076 length:648 start_codon:yes stop_codon:yes gene_type:complete